MPSVPSIRVLWLDSGDRHWTFVSFHKTPAYCLVNNIRNNTNGLETAYNRCQVVAVVMQMFTDLPSDPMETNRTPLLSINCSALLTFDSLWMRIFPRSGFSSCSPDMISSNNISLSPLRKSSSMFSICVPAFLRWELHHAVNVCRYSSNSVLRNVEWQVWCVTLRYSHSGEEVEVFDCILDGHETSLQWSFRYTPNQRLRRLALIMLYLLQYYFSTKILIGLLQYWFRLLDTYPWRIVRWWHYFHHHVSSGTCIFALRPTSSSEAWNRLSNAGGQIQLPRRLCLSDDTIEKTLCFKRMQDFQ